MISRLFVVLFLSLVSTWAHADYYYWVVSGQNYPTPEQAGTARCVQMYSAQGYTLIVNLVMNVQGTGGTFACKKATGEVTGGGQQVFRGGVAPACTAGPSYSYSVKHVVPSRFPSVDGSCKIVVDEIVSCVSPTTGPDAYKVNYCIYKVRKTGETVVGAPATPEPVAAPVPADSKPVNMPPSKAPDGVGGSCPAGSVAAGLDSTGITICMGSGTQPPGVADTKVTDGPPVTVSNADGSQTTMVISTTKNADGSTTTIKTNTTIGTDGTKTIEKSGTTSQTPAGANGRPDVEADKYDLCKQNPMLAICRNSSVTGTCGAIACDGDAIQCATLRATAQMECRQKQDAEDLAASPTKAAGASILAGNDPMQAQIQGALSGTSVDLSDPNLDTSGFLGGGSCLAPFNFQFFGKSIPVSFATVCDNITPLRYGIMLAASILAYLIVARSVLGT